MAKKKTISLEEKTLEEKLDTIEKFIERVQTHIETEEAILLYGIEKPTEEELANIQIKYNEEYVGDKDE